MTPSARIQTAIECLDRIIAGAPAERVLTRWARGARHAGSKDRAAVRDLVFDILRQYWSSAARGGGEDGRGRMIGYLRGQDTDPTTQFTGQGYAPDPLMPDELAPHRPLDPFVELDCPPEFATDLRVSLGDDFVETMQLLRERAPVHLRVNIARTTRQDAQAMLVEDGIATDPVALSATALVVTGNPRAVARSRAFTAGLVELQDAASQALTDALPLTGAARILDYCAGGGGKTLAMAARHRAIYHAHDVSAERLAALIPRAERARVAVGLRTQSQLRSEAPYDLVLVDAPCSGSGAWRRAPEGKIRLDRTRLAELLALQQDILCRAAEHVAPGGWLAFATCSLLDAENRRQIEEFLSRSREFAHCSARRWTPLDGGDGFYMALLQRSVHL